MAHTQLPTTAGSRPARLSVVCGAAKQLKQVASKAKKQVQRAQSGSGGEPVARSAEALQE